MSGIKDHIRDLVSRRPKWFFALFASLAAFLTYSCMYAFRKPFTIGEFQGLYFLGADYKIWLITAQVTGYTLSKFLGIKFIAELKASLRALSILLLVGIAEFALLLFCVVQPPYNFVFMFLNGLPLGVIWGIVFSYLEGRALTEVLGAALSASFIIASGVVKSAGKMVMLNLNVSEFAMPFVTGLIFLVPLICSLFLLDCIPAPTTSDEIQRTKREPMDKTRRAAFIKEFLPGIILLVTVYIFLTIFRELRDNFAVELWKSIGFIDNPAIFTRAEVPVAVFTLVSLALIAFVRNNFMAFKAILYFIASGFLIIFLAAIFFHFHLINGVVWMIATGTGLYLGYVPFNAFLYERLIAAFRVAGNIGFIMYVSDAFGYLGSLGVAFYKNFSSPGLSWTDFFVYSGIFLSIPGMLVIFAALFYFEKKQNRYKSSSYNGYEYASRKSLFAFNTGAVVDK